MMSDTAIEPIGSVDGAGTIPASEALIVEYLRQLHASPVQIALAEAQAKAAETSEELAAGGDPIALARLAKEEDLSAPNQSPQLVSPPATHAPRPHEDGKGDVIDIYD